MPKYDSIRIYPKTKTAISKLSKKFGMTQVDFLDSVMGYMKRSGANPKDYEVLTPAEEIKKLRDTIVSFLRTQEKEYILPVFGKMDTLIVRFMKYLNEEAPKAAEKNISNEPFAESIGDNPNTERTPNHEMKSQSSDEIEQLKNEIERERMKITTTKEYVSRLLENIENKSTGFNRMPVVLLPQSEIDSIKEYIKRL